MNIPNHLQVNRIAFDLNGLSLGMQTGIRDWQGNSYRGIIGYAPNGGHYYTLIHWSTPIAQFEVAQGTLEAPGRVNVLMFDARYISSTTRSFQGRILNALKHVNRADGDHYVAIANELGKPMGMRKPLTLRTNTRGWLELMPVE